MPNCEGGNMSFRMVSTRCSYEPAVFTVEAVPSFVEPPAQPPDKNTETISSFLVIMELFPSR